MEKTCGNCIQCEKYIFEGKEKWACENCRGSEGWPVNCFPPYDEACENWTSNQEDKDKPCVAMHEFIDHFWDNKE